MSQKAKTSTCCTCGFTWLTSRSGSHSCTKPLLKKVEQLEKQVVVLQNQIDNKAATEDEEREAFAKVCFMAGAKSTHCDERAWLNFKALEL